MLLVAALVFLVFRQVMPIAAGLAGGLALSSFGAISRGIGWAIHRTADVGRPAAAYAATHTATTLAGTARSAGRFVGSTALNAGRSAYRRAGAGMDALSRRWRGTHDD
jgi:type IV secretion system protein VirB6